MLREERKKAMEVTPGLAHGPVVALPAGEDSDHFVKVHKKDESHETEQ
jgi:hypothetical protein